MNHKKGTGKAAELPGDKFELVHALGGSRADSTETIRKDARARRALRRERPARVEDPVGLSWRPALEVRRVHRRVGPSFT
ncbi:hypothetical protein [Streptomyces sp. NPDC093568]|uniref:hypothetical protein n=1 Tax=Streptomyces sp. NPDC093568 TaxID=3366041 RepID=UPI0037FED443